MCMLIVARAYECSACKGQKRGSFLGFQAVVTLWELGPRQEQGMLSAADQAPQP